MAKKKFHEAFFYEEGYTDPTEEELKEQQSKFEKEKPSDEQKRNEKGREDGN